MEPALQRRVQRYGWDKASVLYEAYWQQQLKPAQDELMRMADLRPGERLIDIASGTGLVTFPAAEKIGSEGYILATDISDKMMEESTRIAQEKKLSNVSFRRMDAEQLTCGDAEFDVALCALGLMYFPDPLRGLKEMHRVLRPDGRVVVAVWGQRDRCGWADIFEIVDKRVASEVCPMFFNLGNNDTLHRFLEAAGFTKIRAERINTQLVYRSTEEACGAAFAGGPVALAYSKFSDKVKEEAHTEYIESIKPFRQGDGYAIPGEFVIGIGYKQ